MDHEAPRRYTERRALIAQRLQPLFDIDAMVPTNVSAGFEPQVFENSLVCSWADPETLATRTLFVYLNQVEAGSAKAAEIRDMIENETFPSGADEPPEAYEIPTPESDEFAFVLNYLGRVTAITGNCVISIMPSGFTVPLTQIVEPALDIARTVGCTAYLNDLQPPSVNTARVQGVWTTADGTTYDPRTPPNLSQ